MSAEDLVMLGNAHDGSLAIFGTPEALRAFSEEIVERVSRGQGTVFFLPDASPASQESGFRLFGVGLASAEEMEKLREQAMAKVVKETP
jgi:hypothetical protein